MLLPAVLFGRSFEFLFALELFVLLLLKNSALMPKLIGKIAIRLDDAAAWLLLKWM